MEKKVIPEIYVADIKKAWDSESMQKYEYKKYSNICTFDNGLYIVFDKPDIETSFCFDDSFDYDGALAMANHASKSEEYFIKENMQQFDDMINGVLRDDVVLNKKYYSQPSECDLCGWRCYDTYEVPQDALYILTAADKEKMIAVIEEEKLKFKKRLDTYLKRYGMSKIKTWTYWGMA